MNLILHAETLTICRLEEDSPVPDWLPELGFTSITRTANELSIVCAKRAVPQGVRQSGSWCALEVEGPLDFSEVGILAQLSQILARAGISIFVISTFDTDFLLVGTKDCQRTLDVLREAGHSTAQGAQAIGPDAEQS
jgi:hypothetical protein